MRIPARYLLVAAVILSISAVMFAQSATTSLRGTVFDAKGAVIPGASVTLNDAQTGFKRTVISDDHGDYQFLQLIPANYSISVSIGGFATIVQENIQLLVNTPAT